ncbi:MAG TPA: DUF6600 domain-containing protein [Polyangia bacterium]|nr:DUF6600 domain-containing protein [Polyangia bacterium]
MKPSIVVTLFGAAALFGLPAGAQTMPPPYAPPPQLQQPPEQFPPPPQTAQTADGQPVEGQPPTELGSPTGEEGGVPVDPNAPPAYDPNAPNVPNAQSAYDPNMAVNYPAVDLGPDNDIAQGYDDGYDPQAYAQFQTALSPYGAWDYDASYGYVWSPAMSIVGAGFSPYATHGHWVLSEYGWTWVSDWSWGWAPFHYGRWITRANHWSWVPGTMWGPAWVSWRSGNGYVGWSPLPPRGVRMAAGFGARSPWRFTTAAGLGAARPAFMAPRYLPGMFARTTVVSSDRLLSRGRYTVHVNAGPTRGITASPVSLSRVAPNVYPHVAVYPHAGMALNERPWIRQAAIQNDALARGWHAGVPAAPSHTEGRAPLYGTNASVRPGIHSAAPAWSSRPAPMVGSAGSYGRPYGGGWAAPTARPSYGYGAPSTYAPAYRGPAPSFQAPAPSFHAPAPAPAYHAPAPAFTPPSRPAGGDFQGGHVGGVAGSHFGGASGGGHFGGFGGGHRR